MRRLIYILFAILAWSFSSFADDETFYVRPSGTATSKGAASGCSSNSTAASLSWAESNVSKGDTIILCDEGGNFTDTFQPTLEPTQENERVTIQREDVGSTPTFYRVADAFKFTTPYWTVDGITFDASNKTSAVITASNSGSDNPDYIEIANCTISYGYSYGMIKVPGNHWYIHDNTFNRMDPAEDSAGEHPQLSINPVLRGTDNSLCTADKVPYGCCYGSNSGECYDGYGHIIMDNEFIDGGGHGMLEIHWSQRNVIKGNTFRTTGTWYRTNNTTNEVTDHTILILKRSSHYLIEGNTFYEAGNAFGDYHTMHLHIHNSDYITARYNISYDHDGAFADPYHSNVAGHVRGPSQIWVYNNTFYNQTLLNRVDAGSTVYSPGLFNYGSPTNWFCEADNEPAGFDCCDGEDIGTCDETFFVDDFHIMNNIMSKLADGISSPTPYVLIKNPGDGADNSRYGSFKNNIVYDFDETNYIQWKTSYYDLSDRTLAVSMSIDDNLTSDPLMADPANQDFTLQSGSPAIDAAVELTTVSSTATASSMPVGDTAPFFTTGAPYSLHPTWVTAAGLQNDTIRVVGDGSPASFTAVINGIDVANGELDLDKSYSFESGMKVYHCPGGACFHGDAPDMGAYEFTAGRRRISISD
jgi:hypothetical protein